MKTAIAAALAALALAPAAYAASPAKPGPSVTVTSLADLLANPATKAVMDKYLPGLGAHPNYGMVKGMTVKQLSGFPQAGLTPEKVAAMQADFDKLTK